MSKPNDAVLINTRHLERLTIPVSFSTGTTKDGVKGYTGQLTYQNGYIQLYKGPAPTLKPEPTT